MRQNEKLNNWILKQHGAELRDFSYFKRPWFWRKFALDAVTLEGKYIYFRDADKLSEAGFTALLFHEGFHAQSQRRIGWTRYMVRYALSPSFRMAEEIEAYLRQIEAKYALSGIDAARDLRNRVPKMLAENYLLKSKRDEIETAMAKGLADILTGKRHVVRDILKAFEAVQ